MFFAALFFATLICVLIASCDQLKETKISPQFDASLLGADDRILAKKGWARKGITISDIDCTWFMASDVTYTFQMGCKMRHVTFGGPNIVVQSSDQMIRKKVDAGANGFHPTYAHSEMTVTCSSQKDRDRYVKLLSKWISENNKESERIEVVSQGKFDLTLRLKTKDTGELIECDILPHNNGAALYILYQNHKV